VTRAYPEDKATMMAKTSVMTAKANIKKCVPESRMDEYEDLRGLLMENLSGRSSGGPIVAEWVAACCMGENHLWQDMGLGSRDELSVLMKKYFRPLFDTNVSDMKWKKFFYRKICEREGFMLCKSPTCGECADYRKCFGPEAADAGVSAGGGEEQG